MAHKQKKSRPGSKKPGGKSTARLAKNRRLPNWPLLGLSLAGAALTAYLTVTAWSEASPLYCGEGSSCDLVQSSRWGSFLGLPTAFWGLLGYLALGHIAYRVRSAARHWQFSWVIALMGAVYSVYLTVISLTVLEAICTYCLVSLALMLAILVTVTLQRPAGMPGFSWPGWAGQTTLLALLIVGGMHLHFSGVFDPASGPEDPYLKGLAEHLTSSGAIFYGAYW